MLGAWVLGLWLGCGPKGPVEAAVSEAPAEEVEVREIEPQDPAAGVADEALRALLVEHWDWQMSVSPVWATMLGDHRFDDQLGDGSPAGVARERASRRTFLERARGLPTAGLSAGDVETLEIFVGELEREAATDVCVFEQWNVSPRHNALVWWSFLPEAHTVASMADGHALLKRYQQIPTAIDDHVANLRLGLASGRTPNAHSLRLVVEQVDAELAKPDTEWALYAPHAAAHADWDQMGLVAYRKGIADAIGPIRTAFERYRTFLHDEVMPVARGADAEGMAALPDGGACYEATILRETSLPLKAGELHATGLAELERIHAEMADLGEKAFGTRDRAAIFERLRTDPTLHFTSAEEVEAKAVASLDKARAAIPSWFGRLPAADCVVRRVPDYEAPYTTIAYYRQPSPDGSKPGEYYVNVYAPETRPQHEAEVLAFHESIPGHHLQIAIAQELPELPAFRRHGGATSFVEGWALYSERLADEMGLYGSDLDRMGMLAFDTWRAARLVVDTGLHAEGWTRERAVAFMIENTPLAPNNVENEVDRYLTTPGQALAYKTGQLAIRRLRAEAEAGLGDRFPLPAFHDAVLGGGAVPLPVLERRVRGWIEATKGGGGSAP